MNDPRSHWAWGARGTMGRMDVGGPEGWWVDAAAAAGLGEVNE